MTFYAARASDLSPHETQARILEQLAKDDECQFYPTTRAALTAGAQALRENADLRKEVAELRGKIAERD